MVRPLGIRGDCYGDARDAEEHEDERPPGEVGEATVDGRYYGADKGDDPGELYTTLATRSSDAAYSRILTMPMDMVARAKGSPMMRLMLKPDDLWP
jgi:hypothetical protein